MTEFDKVIPPGGVGKITASLDTSHYRGPIAKSVQVTTNDPDKKQFVLTLKAAIVSVIDVVPTDSPNLQVRLGEKIPVQKLTVSTSDHQAFDILSMEADPTVAVTIEPAPEVPSTVPKKRPRSGPIGTGSNSYLVTITPKAAEAPVGRSVANVTLTTNRREAPTVPIHAFLLVLGPLQVNPQQLFVRPGPTAPVQHVRITKLRGAGDLKILKVESSDPAFKTSATPVSKGHEYDLAVQYTGKPGRGTVKARITVKTNEPSQPSIVIPLTGQI